MANKAISELPQAQNVNNQDLFVLEQSGIAKKLPAETFITEQGIIDALAEALDGHGGIQSVTLSSVSGRIRTYRITFTDQSATTFQVYDGTSIDRISRTSSSGLDDVYTIFLSDGTTTFFTVHNGADGTVSEAMLNDALKDKAPAVTETTESSAIANFTDGADDMVMHNIVAEINPVQSGSGDPSPDNIRPISGWTGCNVTRTGKNLFNYDAWVGVSVQRGTAVFENNGVTLTATANDAFTWYDSAFPSGARIPVKEGETIILSWEESTNAYGGVYIFPNGGTTGLVTVNNAYAKQLSYTATSGITYVTFRVGVAASGTTISYKNIMVRPASLADSTYEPYVTPSTVSLSWQTEAGTVYGGTIDVATGLLTVDRAMVDAGTLSWNYSGESTNHRFSANMPSDYKQPTSAADRANIICSRYAANPSVVATTTALGISGYQGGPAMFIRDLAFSDNPSFNAAMSGVQIVYELATPQTYQLTPQDVKTLLGTNNVWADTGDTSVTYTADTKLYIEKLTMPTEDDLVANQAITSGKYFMIGNSLYLALANIASGAQITIGTNAQRVSLADALNTINS